VKPASSACISRPVTPGDFDEVAELLHRIFGVRRTAEVLRWKFMGCAGRPIGSVALTQGDRIVGFLGQIPVRVRVMGREVAAAQGADMGILDEHRRLDAFLRLTQTSVAALREAGVALTYGMPTAEAASATAELLGQKWLSALPLLVRPLRADAQGMPGAGARFLARVLSSADRFLLNRIGHATARLRVTRVTRFDSRFDRFWCTFRDDYPVMLVRDAAYLNWRYVDAPATVYERVCVEDVASGRVEGYVVLGVCRRGLQLRGQIADLVTVRDGDPLAGRLLICAALDWLRAQAADVVEVWSLPRTHLRPAFLRRGFVPRRTAGGGLHASVLPMAGDINLLEAEEAKHWFLSMGDSDMV
jgi:hypothetical protein